LDKCSAGVLLERYRPIGVLSSQLGQKVKEVLYLVQPRNVAPGE